jgi:acetyl-CoA carboxylase biotin carboxylase subunit
VIEGIDTTIPLFLRLLEQPEIIDGEYDIHWLENFLKQNAGSA